jgi:uncharacterized membrane protein YozB (DUF420 family)
MLLAIVLVFAIIRVVTDTPFLLEGRLPDRDSFEFRYVAHPALAYTHIVPGILFLFGACFQLSRSFRHRHLAVHKRMGRVVLLLGLVSGAFALAFGVPFSFGGAWQALATAVFGSYFLISLVLAYLAIRRKDVTAHRRWMIRAFAIGLGVASIRLWVGHFAATGWLSFVDSFAPAFWLGLGAHAIAAELWLFARPLPSGARKRPALAG